MYQTQIDIEKTYSRANIRNHVMADVEQDHTLFQQMIKLVNAYRTKIYYSSKMTRLRNLTMSTEDLVIEIFIAVLPVKEINPIQSICTKIGERLGYEVLLDGVKTAAELLAVTESAGLFTIYHSNYHDNETGTMGLKAEYILEDSTQELIDTTKYLPPMVCPPAPWISNKNGGNINGSGSILLGYLNHHDQHQSLDVINILQNIGWSLNPIVEYEEEAKTALDTPEKKEQFNHMTRESLTVYKELMSLGNKFFFVWKYDKRGRMYSQGYHCNLQSTEYKKAILNFTKTELIQ